jgi:hypothetical protein
LTVRVRAKNKTKLLIGRTNMRKPLVRVTLVVGLLLGVCGSVAAQVTVSGKACPFFAGQTVIPPLYGDDLDLETRPAPITVYSGSTISLSAAGTWGHAGGAESGPDGRAGAYDPTYEAYVNLGGISRVIAPLNTLIGVFLTDAAPDPGAKPTDLVLGTDDMTAPALQQTFAIGSSLANLQVPAGATRLFLGLNDGYEWTNNVGSVAVMLTRSMSVEIKPETLNLASKGVFTAFIDLPEGLDVALVTAECAGASAQKCLQADGKLIAKFNCADLVGVTPGEAVELTVVGELTDGTLFTATDTVRVIDQDAKK